MNDVDHRGIPWNSFKEEDITIVCRDPQCFIRIPVAFSYLIGYNAQLGLGIESFHAEFTLIKRTKAHK